MEKTQNKQFSTSYEDFVCENCWFCFLVFAYFCFVSWFLLVMRFFYSKFIVEKIWNWFDSFIHSTTSVYPLNSPMKDYFSPNSFYLYAIIFNCVNLLPPTRISSFVRTFFIYAHFWESLLYCNNLFLSLRTCSYLWSSVRIFWSNFLFYSLYENKQVYEYHHLKKIFDHQNMVMIFCWLRIFQIHVFCFEFFLFCFWLIFY